MGKKSLINRGETRELNKDSRSSAPGRFIELSDGMVHYEMQGSSKDQIVVLIPGFSVPYSIWDPTFVALVDAGFRVLRYDLYGRGYSDRPDTINNQELFDRQLCELLNSLGIDGRVDLIGLSMGGAISVVFAERHSAMVRKLCLIDPAGLPWKQPFKAKLAQAPILGELVMSLFGDKVLISNLKDYFHSEGGDSEILQDFENQMHYFGFKKSILSTLRSGVTIGAEKAYERVGKQGRPVLLMWGRDDQVVPFELSERVMELIPHAEFHPIDGAAHLPHYECPNVVNPILIKFLKK